jgi:thiamine-phosphate pyrophosphorylase
VDHDFPAEPALRLERLTGLYAIVGATDTVPRAAQAIEGGASVVQVRMKDAPASAILDATRRIVALARGSALVLVNDRADLAMLAGADGVHVGDDDLPTAEARRLCGPSMLVGRTCRSAQDARQAVADGADHVGFGPVFASRTKPLAVEPCGLDGLRAAVAAVGVPVVAISGIGLDNIGQVAAAGAAAAAVIADLFEHGDVRARAALLRAAFVAGRGERP